MTRLGKRMLPAALAAGLVLGFLPQSSTAFARPAQAQLDLADVVEKALPSVVNISAKIVNKRPRTGDPFFDQFFGGPSKPQGSLGSGVIVSAKGYVLTNNHVVARGSDIRVFLHDGRELKAKLIGADPDTDLAVLKLQGNVGSLVPVSFGDSSSLRLGETVLAIGNPFGIGQTVTRGIVSAKGRSLGMANYEDYIQTDAAINPGNSGGALINMNGELIGINTIIMSKSGGSQGIGFAIPTSLARPVMDKLISSGVVVRGWLGVSIQDVTQELAEALKLSSQKGVLIGGVVSGSPAAKAGIKRGDVVVSIDKRATDNASKLRNAVAAAGAGKSVSVEIIRAGKHRSMPVVLGTLKDPQRAQPAPAVSNRQVKPLGLRTAPLNKATRKRYKIPADIRQGVVVTGMSPNGAAAQLGLRPGDVLLQINQKAIKSQRSLEGELAKRGDKVALLLYRDGATVYVMVSR